MPLLGGGGYRGLLCSPIKLAHWLVIEWWATWHVGQTSDQNIKHAIRAPRLVAMCTLGASDVPRPRCRTVSTANVKCLLLALGST